MKRKKNRKNRIRCGKSERFLKIVAVTVSLLFAALMLYPLVFAVSSAMKDNSQIYKVPPKLLPGKANSVSFVLDYTGQEFQDAEEMKDQMLKDNVLVMFGTNFKFADQSIMEIHVYGTREGRTLFHSRAHQMKLQMECDYGIYKRTAIKKEILLHDDRYVRACESIGYEFDENGIDKVPEEGLADDFQDQIAPVIQEKYTTAGTLVSIGNRTKNLLSLESFKYYLDMPAYIYPQSERVVKYGFLTFVMNSVIVIGFAMIAQVILCSVCAFVISRQLSQRAGKFVLMFFLGGMMIPFASIMLPQLIMYREMGAYNNYAALLLPFLYPYGFYVYLYKGFFDQIPGSYFEAAALDGAGSWYLYSRICMPLSKPIISLIALQTFIGNWNDFFWAWLVTEDQNLWTLNVALYNISNNAGTKQNALMGLAVVTITPVILLSILFSRQLKQSIAASGVKG
ncbi:MAG: carbohydrate ABC transporter permease [Blautia sp.]|uniref:carbohydrate ABC transporter permease n=1 Tax=Blautia sp. TaxID=1955243 RepID=UPI002A74DEA8|nr:carbohydrate ABC transporter permease [Blautia sp.]MDY3015933.1 carbohydrate ABC transporter permease [Blautia sp.]